jgi:hypothetical protein
MLQVQGRPCRLGTHWDRQAKEEEGDKETMISIEIALDVAICLLFFCIGAVMGTYITAWYYALKERDEEWLTRKFGLTLWELEVATEREIAITKTLKEIATSSNHVPIRGLEHGNKASESRGWTNQLHRHVVWEIPRLDQSGSHDSLRNGQECYQCSIRLGLP